MLDGFSAPNENSITLKTLSFRTILGRYFSLKKILWVLKMIRIEPLFPQLRPTWIPIVFLLAIAPSNIHGSTFDKEFTSSKHFIDKTLLLQEFFSSKSRTFLTAPRGFGKTTNLNMIDKFSQIEFDPDGKPQPDRRTAADLFKSLQIGRNETVMEHLGNHPVIFFDMDLQIDGEINDDKIRVAFSAQLNKTFSRYSALIAQSSHISTISAEYALMKKVTTKVLDEAEIKKCLSHLATLLNKHFNRTVILLIDNYDHIVHNYFVDSKGYLDHVYKLFEEMVFNCYLYESHSIDFAMVASITGTAYRCFGLHNFFNLSSFYETHPYNGYFGLAKPEIDDLQTKYPGEEPKTSIIEQYCGGYHIKFKNNQTGPIYNTSCVINYFQATDKASWIALQKPSQPSNFLWKLFKTPEYLDQVSRLIKYLPVRYGRSDYISLTNFTKLVIHDFKEPNFTSGVNSSAFSYMIQTGLLTPIPARNLFCIPNFQIRNHFMNDLFYFYDKVINIDLKSIGARLNEFFNPERNFTAARVNLMESLTTAFGKLPPMYTSFRNETFRLKAPTDFTYQTVVHLAALTDEQMEVIEDYPQPISYEKSTANTNLRCVTYIRKDEVALLTRISNQQGHQKMMNLAMKYQHLEKELGIDVVIVLAIYVEPDNRVLIDVKTSKFTDPISQNSTFHYITSIPKITKPTKPRKIKNSTKAMKTTNGLVSNTTDFFFKNDGLNVTIPGKEKNQSIGFEYD